MVNKTVVCSIVAMLLGSTLAQAAIQSGSGLLKAFAGSMIVVGGTLLLFYAVVLSGSPRIAYARLVPGTTSLFLILALLGLLTILRGHWDTDVRWTDIWIISTGAPAWLIPFISLGARSVDFTQSFLAALRICLVIAVPLIPALLMVDSSAGGLAEVAAWNFLFGWAFLWVAEPHSRFARAFSVLGMLLTLAVGLLATRRYLLLNVFLCWMYFLFMPLVRNDPFQHKALRLLPFAGLFFLLLAVVSGAFPLSTSFSELLLSVSDKGLQNTREGLINDVFSQLESVELLFGRGVAGLYASGIEFTTEGYRHSQVAYRSVVEIGWLQTILKAGLLYLITKTALMAWGLKRGVIQSSPLQNAALLIVCLHAIESFYFAIPSLTGHYALFWFSLGVLLLDPILVGDNATA